MTVQPATSVAAAGGMAGGRTAGRAATWLALAGFALAGPLVVAMPKGLWLAGVLVALARLATLAAGAGGLRQFARDLMRLRSLWLLAALGVASALWAVAPDHSLERGLRLLLELAVGALMLGFAREAPPAEGGRLLRALAAGLAVAAVAGIADILTDGAVLGWAHEEPVAIYAYGRGAAFAAVAAVPLAILLWQHRDRLWAIVGPAAAIAFVAVAANETAKLVLPLAVAGAALALWRWTRPLPALAFAAALVATPLVLPQPMDGPLGCWLMEQKLSVVHRVGIWNFVDSAAAERPLLGWGLEASRRIPGGTTQLAMPDCGPELGPDALGPRIGERLPLHPHGFALNTWLELGAVGAFLLLVALLDLARGLARMPRARAIAPCAAVSAALFPAAVSFGMWQGWWLTTLFLLAALCLLAPARDAGRAGR